MDKIALVVLDGFGHAAPGAANAISRARMPMLDVLKKHYPHALLDASGCAVGLAPGTCGNSEVGHLTLGAGAVVPSVQQQLDDIKDFRLLPGLERRFAQLAASAKPLHLIGMLSDGGIHSHSDHLFALLIAARNAGIETIYLHAILDGRDVSPQSAASYLTTFESYGIGTLASMHGRFYAMDRDNNTERIARSYAVLTKKTAVCASWREALAIAYANNLSDELVEPVLLNAKGVIQDGDGVLFFNIRPDRARQLTTMFVFPDQSNRLSLAFFLTLGHFDDRFAAWGVHSLVQPARPATTLWAQLAAQRPDLRIACLAESEKYAHVSYFFDGRSEQKRPNVSHMIVPSNKKLTPDQDPGMAADQITQKALSLLANDRADCLVINYANADMVGHTGNLAATVAACEVLDAQLGVLHQELVVKRGGALIITADHGNAEQMVESNGLMCKAHTSNPVPLVLAASSLQGQTIIPGNWGLSNVAPTILQLLGCCVPREMDEPVKLR